MRIGRGFFAAVALAATPISLAGADTLTHAGEEWLLGDVRLTAPHARRALVQAEGPRAAFRFDGNSNWLESGETHRIEPAYGIAVGAWIALAAPPADTGAIVHIGEAGLLLGLNRWRLPEVRLGGLRAAGDTPVPVGEWRHVAADYDGRRLRLRIDGEVVAEAVGDVAAFEGRIAIGRAVGAGYQQEVHPLGTINGILGDVTLTSSADPVAPGPPPREAPDLDAPEAWYADDPDRPRLFPLGATGWTNEPHALTWRDGLWHLFFQANPNGAYWRDIVWGHQVSRDLVTWERRRPALMPTTGFDRRGVWVGNWIPDHDPPSVLYTGVNGEWAGIGLAESSPGGWLNLVEVVAHDTPHAYQDMRDPWVLRTEDGWLMLIGAGARDRREAMIFTYRSTDGVSWEPAGEFDTGGAKAPGQFWELPMLLPIEGRWVLMGTPVVEGVPARTIYWIGDFDGRGFVPDDPEPSQFDILATYRAPTLAYGPDGDLVAIGIIADELRDERARRDAGWVHVLTPATTLALCDDDATRICQTFAPALEEGFRRVIDEQEGASVVSFEASGEPVLLSARIAAPQGGTITLGMRLSEDGDPAAEVTIDAATGTVRLDYTRGPLKPLSRPPVLQGMIPPSRMIDMDLMIDGAAVFGAINGRPLGLLAFGGSGARGTFRLVAEDGAAIDLLRVKGRE